MSDYQPGRYAAKIQACGFGETPVKGTPFLQVDFQPTHIHRDDKWVPIDNGFIRNIKLWFSDKAGQRSIDQLRAWGWEGTDLRELESGIMDGKVIEVVCRGKNDKGYDEFDLPMPKLKQQTVESDKKVTEVLRRKWNKLLRVEKMAPEPVPVSNGRPDADDDIPF